MNCRPAERRDMEEIKVLLKLSFDRIYAHYARQSLAALTDTLVAEEAGVVIGFVNWRLFTGREEDRLSLLARRSTPTGGAGAWR